MAKIPNYVECAGVRIPANWGTKQLREALVERKIKFQNEAEIIAVFQQVPIIKESLDKQIATLVKKQAVLTNIIATFKKQLTCPYCHKILSGEEILKEKGDDNDNKG